MPALDSSMIKLHVQANRVIYTVGEQMFMNHLYDSTDSNHRKETTEDVTMFPNLERFCVICVHLHIQQLTKAKSPEIICFQ